MREEEKQTSTKNGSKVQTYLRKRWVFPAIYIASAALLLTGVLWFQSSSNSGNVAEKQQLEQSGNRAQGDQVAGNQVIDQQAVEVTAQKENIAKPVQDDAGISVQQPFYDTSGTSEEQEAALVFYNDTYYRNTGIDYAMENGESFDVLAALSGTVIEAEKDSLLGNVIKIKHENGVTTQYTSLGDMFVKVGEKVDQGKVIGTAGTNVYKKDAGVHVHFELRQNDKALNPADYFEQPISSIGKQEPSQDEQTTKSDKSSQENKQAEPNKDAAGTEPSKDTTGTDSSKDTTGTDSSKESNSSVPNKDASIGTTRT